MGPYKLCTKLGFDGSAFPDRSSYIYTNHTQIIHCSWLFFVSLSALSFCNHLLSACVPVCFD